MPSWLTRSSGRARRASCRAMPPASTFRLANEDHGSRWQRRVGLGPRSGSPSKLLFLDEPSGAMDTQTELYFIEHLKIALAPDQTLIVSTHRHNMLSILDRLIVIDGGRIIADGPRDQVLGHLNTAQKEAKS